MLFMCTKVMYRMRKFQLKGGGGCQDVKTKMEFIQFLKWTWKLNCDGGIHQRP